MRIKTQQEIDYIKEGGHELAKILRTLTTMVEPGVATGELEKTACALMAKIGARPSFKGYRANKKDTAYPTALCVSVNDEVVHVPALPSRDLKDGDIVSIDIGMEYKGLYTDMATTIGVGQVSAEAAKLMQATEKSLALGIKAAQPGASLYDVGKAVEDYVVSQGFAVVRQLVGHGVGHSVHEAPQIPNFAVEANKKEKLEAGMVICIEPMVNAGKWEIKVGRDNWTVKTVDGSLSAHFEHTIAITPDGPVIMTE